jgi:hypothetical protein
MSPSKPPDGWKPPAELDRPLPRPVGLTSAGILLCVLPVLLLAGGALGAFHLSQARRAAQADVRRWRIEGGWADAAVTRLSRSAEDSGDYLVDYEFKADGRVYSAQLSVDGDSWAHLHHLSPLLVRYLRSDPARHYVTAFPPGIAPAWPPFFVGGAGAAACLWLVLQVRRQRRLLKSGLPAPAVVTSLRKLSIVHYQFDLPGGGVCKGWSRVEDKFIRQGSAICVLYDPRYPRRNAPYPLRAVRVAEK